MLKVVNNDILSIIVLVNDENKHCLLFNSKLDISVWKPNNKVTIGYIMGNGLLHSMINHIQILPSTFVIATRRNYAGIPLPSDITFYLQKDAVDESKYSDEQLKQVAKLFECDCVKKNCPCMNGVKNDICMQKEICQVLVKKGLVTEKQLNLILNDLF